MRNKFSLAAALVLFVAVAAPTSVVAQQDAATSQSDLTTTVAQDSESETTDERPTAVAQGANEARSTRINEYKDRVTDQITAVQARRIATACEAAQTKVTAVKARYDTAVQRRKDAYDNVATKLSTLVEKLQAASVDTTELEAAIAELDSLITAATAALEQYGVTLVDLSEMDCAADPEGFQATLTVAREQRAAAITASNAVKAYARGELKTLLQAIREQLDTDNSTNGS